MGAKALTNSELEKLLDYTISTSYRTVQSTIWEILYDFPMFCDLFHEHLGK